MRRLGSKSTRKKDEAWAVGRDSVLKGLKTKDINLWSHSRKWTSQCTCRTAQDEAGDRSDEQMHFQWEESAVSWLLTFLPKWDSPFLPQSHTFNKEGVQKNPCDWTQKVTKNETDSCSSCALHRTPCSRRNCSHEKHLYYRGLFMCVLYLVHFKDGQFV